MVDRGDQIDVGRVQGRREGIIEEEDIALLDILADTRTAFFGLCLDGQQVLRTMMEQDHERLCGAKNVPNPDRRAYRGGSVRGEVTLGGRRILVPRLRARSVDGHEIDLPSFVYAAGRDPLDARKLEAIATARSTRCPRGSASGPS